MNDSIDNILGQLGLAIQAQTAAADARADAIEARWTKFYDGLSALLVKSAHNDHKMAGAGEETSGLRESKGQVSRASRVICSDEAILAALTNNWITAAKLRQQMLSRGIKMAEGTVYNRMRKLAANRPDMIEAAAKPERWRLKAIPSPRKKVVHRNPNSVSRAVKTVRKHADVGEKEATGFPLNVTKSANDNSPIEANITSKLPVYAPLPLNTDAFRPVLHHGDCLEVMKTLPDDSVDLILADLPYGTTRLEIDDPLPLDELWREYRRILRKPHGNIVLFGSQPFTTALINSAPDIFRYAMVWEKNSSTGFQHADAKPLKIHEDILVFSYGVNISAKRTKRRATYNDQQAVPVKRKATGQTKVSYLSKAIRGHPAGHEFVGLTNCQTSILRFAKDAKKGKNAHPFAKPVGLLDRLIQTYSNPGEVVLDNTMGSGSTCVAAMKAGRKSIGIEIDQEWFEVAQERIELVRQKVCSNATVRACLPQFSLLHADIYQGDCLEVMRQMPSGSVDLVVTSPPYNLALSKRSGMKKSAKSSNWHNAKLADGYRSYDDALPHDQYVEWMQNVLRESWRLLSDDGAIFLNHKPRIQKGKLWTPLELNPDLPVRQIVIWDRGSGMNFNRSFFTPSHEWIVILAKSEFRMTKTETKFPKDVWHFPPERKNDHPAPFPLELPMTAIEHTSAKVVLDPFMGSGTTGVAALRCGREFIGIELDDDYAAKAASRIQAETMRLAA